MYGERLASDNNDSSSSNWLDSAVGTTRQAYVANIISWPTGRRALGVGE